MKEIRIHGRGGQGSVVTAELIAIAAFAAGRYSLAFPYLGGGGERRGAPVQAFVRIGDEKIRLRSKVQSPDYVLVQDPSLLKTVDVLQGLKEGGMLLINTEALPPELQNLTRFKVFNVPATRIAMDNLGKPITNTAMLGAFAAVTKEIQQDALGKAIKEKFAGELGEKNVLAMQEAFAKAGDVS